MLTRPNLPDKRMLRIAALPGLLLALCACFGFCLIAYDRVPYASPLLWAAALGLTLVCTLLFCALWLALAKAEALLERAKPRFSGLFGRQWLLWLLILLCWTPCWLAVFPGNFAYDTGGEYDQCAFGFSRAYPRLHSWLNIEIINRSFGLTGSFNAGVALFTLLHMALLALLFSWMLRRLHRLGLNGWVLLAGLVWCALFPTVQMLAVSPIRDMMFAGNLTALCFLLVLLGRDHAAFWRSPGLILGLAALSALTILSRNNSSPLLALCVLALLALVLLLGAGKDNRRGALLFAAAAFLLYGGLNAFLSAACRPEAEASVVSGYAALTQPITRCYALDGKDWSEQERSLYASFFRTEGQTYVENDGDVSLAALKKLRGENGLGDFARLWLTLFRRYPGTYLDAWLAHTRALWLPGDVIDGYVRSGGYEGRETCYFYYTRDLPGPGHFRELLPAVHDFYERIGTMLSFERIPVLREIFSVGFHFWLLLGTLFYLRWRRRQAGALLLLLAYALLSALCPLILVRYFAALYLAFPLLLASLLQPGRLYAEQPRAVTVSADPK